MTPLKEERAGKTLGMNSCIFLDSEVGIRVRVQRKCVMGREIDIWARSHSIVVALVNSLMVGIAAHEDDGGVGNYVLPFSLSVVVSDALCNSSAIETTTTALAKNLMSK